MSTDLIALQSVSFGYRGTEVLHDIDLRVAPGRIHALVGLNGAGKTSLMRVVLGTAVPASGTATVLGHRPDVATRSWSEAGYLLDAAFDYRELTGRETIYSAARMHRLSRSRAGRAVDEVATEFDLTGELDKRVRRLSLGNRQRVALAAAMVHRPRLLVLDEPTIALDPLAVVRLRDSLKSAADAGAGILVSSHHLDEVARIADDVTVLHRGRVVASLDPDEPDLERRFFDLVYRMELEAKR